MKQTIKSILIFILLVGFSNYLGASDVLTSDSLKIAHIVNEFYDWYLTSIKEKKYSDYMPVFVESKIGMTTLDYAVYLNNLKLHRFSDSLINKERQSYDDCSGNLEKVKFDDFQKSCFTDLDEYEQINCDFTNFYRWIGGQEPIDGIKIIEIRFLATDTSLVSINYFELHSKENQNDGCRTNNLTLIRIGSNWFIDNIDSSKFD